MRDLLRLPLRVLRHPVAQNVLALGSVQVAIVVVPLVTLPYLARVLDRDELGLVVFTQTFSFMVALVVEYGFNLSATREVARGRDDPAALVRTVAGVMGAKLGLSGLATLVAVALWPLIPIFAEEPALLAYGVLLGVVQGFLPVWFYLGIERARTVALSELASRLGSLVLMVLLVRDGGDGELVLLIYVVTGAASVLYLLGRMYRSVDPVRPSAAASRQALRSGRTLFAGTGAVAFYTGSNAFLLGLLVPAGQVALFAAAEKVVRAGTRVLTLMTTAVYPRVSLLLSRGRVERANRLSLVAMAVFASAALAASLVLVVLAPEIVSIVYGPRFEDSVALLQILALLLPINIVGVALSTQWLLPRGLDRRVTEVVIAAALLNVVLLVAATELFGLEASALACVVVELFVMSGNALSLRRATTRRPARADALHPDVTPGEGPG